MRRNFQSKSLTMKQAGQAADEEEQDLTTLAVAEAIGNDDHPAAEKVSDDAPPVAVLPAMSIFDENDAFFERKSIIYFQNILKMIDRNSLAARRICAGVEANVSIPGFPEKLKDDAEHSYYGYENNKHSNAVTEKDWALIQSYFQQKFDSLPEAEPSISYKNLQKLADVLGLDEMGRGVLELLQVMQSETVIAHIISVGVRSSAKTPLAVAHMIGQPDREKKIANFLSADGPLVPYDLIEYSSESKTVFPVFEGSVWAMLAHEYLESNDIVRNLFGQSSKGKLVYEDVEYLGKKLDGAIDVVGEARTRKLKGVNILIWGDPGTGKTGIADVIAARLGMDVYSIGEDQNSEGTNTDYRYNQVLQADGLLINNENALLRVDEFEDFVLRGTHNKDKNTNLKSKVDMGKLLTENARVRVFTANSLDDFDEPLLQRFTYILHVTTPPTLVRKNIWDKHLQANGVALPEEDVLDLARTYRLPGRMIENATLLKALTGGDVEDIKRQLEEKSLAITEHRDTILASAPLPKKFSADFLNIVSKTSSLDSLTKRGRERHAFALAVQQASHAGGEHLTRYIGEQMVMNVIEFSAEDLITHNGKTTAADRVRNLFQLAVDQEAFLVINHIDLLEKEKGLPKLFAQAARTHKLPLAVIGSKEGKLSPALDHVFSERVVLDAMTAAQGRAAYQAYLGHEAPAELDSIQNLTEEVLDRTSQIAHYQGVSQDNDSILKIIEREQKGLKASAPGFNPVS